VSDHRFRPVSSSIRDALAVALAARVPASRPPAWHRAIDASTDLIEASVLLPLFDRAGEVHVWLIKRPDTMKRHKGQIAFPGGKRDPEDATPVETALRETEEEVGFPRAEIDILGALDRFPTSTGFAITPIVGWLRRDLVPTPNAAEIARVLSPPLATFVRQEPRPRPLAGVGWSRVAPSWEIEGEIVWGATAKILMELAAIVRDL
jgi:8-oxo-dGTP pyrophosphatase MutT (NUDIX family)